MINKQIPVTVIGGYLGAGKSTLLNHILRNNKGIRFAVMVNDFGNINIDIDLIESQDGDTINLANGCICCSLAGGFGAAMLSIRDRLVHPDRVLIEASGVSDPFKIAQYAHLPGFRRDSMIVLADAETIRKRATDKYVGRQVIQQLKSADLLVLNKVDLISDDQRTLVKNWLHDLVTGIRLLEVSHGKIPVDILFGEEVSAAVDEPKTGVKVSREKHEHEHHHDHDYVSWSYSGSNLLDGAKFRALIENLDASVLRGKGFLYLKEDPSVQFIFQLVGKRWSIEKSHDWGEHLPKTQFVLIGLSGCLDAETLDKNMQDMELR
jgi:G3E family GTPase